MDKLDATEVEKICDLYEGVMSKSTDVAKSEELRKLEECLFKYKALLAEKSPTAKLNILKL